MKRIRYLLCIIVITSIIGCTTDPCEEQYCLSGGYCVDGICICPPNAPKNDYCDSLIGQCTFVAADTGCGKITISIEGKNGTLDSIYKVTPSCKSKGTFTVSLFSGDYTYSAKTSYGIENKGKVTIQKGQCYTKKILCSDLNMADVTFKNMNSNIYCKYILVSIAGYPSKPIQYLPEKEVKECNSPYGANYKLPAGTYTALFKCSSNNTQSSTTFTLKPGQCYIHQVK